MVPSSQQSHGAPTLLELLWLGLKLLDGLGCAPLGCEPLTEGGPMLSDGLGCEPLGCEPPGCEPLGEPLGCEPLGEPLGDEPLGEPLGDEPLGDEPLGELLGDDELSDSLTDDDDLAEPQLLVMGVCALNESLVGLELFLRPIWEPQTSEATANAGKANHNADGPLL